MEILAFTYVAASYEDPNPDPELQPLILPNSVWMGLVSVFVLLAALQQAPDPAMAASVYGQGSNGNAVKAIQQALGIEQDGVFGPLTKDSVLRFQAKQGLAADGLVGPKTAAALGLNSIIDSSPYQPTSSGTAGTYYVRTSSGGGVLLRSGPGTNTNVVGTAADGAALSLTDAHVNANGYTWGQLTSGSWVATDYLYQATSTPTTPPGGNSGGTTVRAGSGLLVRSGPGLAYGVTGSLGYGATVSLTGQRVYRNGYTWGQLSSGGWVATDYLR